MENDQEPQLELMYKAPGRESHQNLPEILDEIMNRLDAIEKTLTTFEFQD